MNTVVIEVQNARKVFTKEGLVRLPWRRNGKHKEKQVVAVNKASFEVRRGEIFGVLGPNGSGKSTLVRLIATLLLPDDGKLTVLGHDVEREPLAVQQAINRVSVEASFFKKLSPFENLLYGARLYGLSAKVARDRIHALLTRMGIERVQFDQPLEEMSRGMQQKVAIARALVTEPSVLLMDEPTTGLDPRSKREVQAMVLELRERNATTILLTTHDMTEAETLCDRIAIMDSGEIVALDTPKGLRSMVAGSHGHKPTLEDVFLELTGKKLTDAGEDSPTAQEVKSS